MRCPSCEGELEPITLQTVSGEAQACDRCTQCGGFWFGAGLDKSLLANSVAEYDHPQPDFSLQSYSFSCPVDKTLLQPESQVVAHAGSKSWICPDCGGIFFQRGQLALLTNHQQQNARGVTTPVLSPRAQATMAGLMVAIGAVAIFASADKITGQGLILSAATNNPLPTAGPSVVTLILLAITYLAGTILAVLGRKLPLIILGWGVIAICLFGFAVIVFGP